MAATSEALSTKAKSMLEVAEQNLPTPQRKLAISKRGVILRPRKIATSRIDNNEEPNRIIKFM